MRAKRPRKVTKFYHPEEWVSTAFGSRKGLCGQRARTATGSARGARKVSASTIAAAPIANEPA